MRWRRLSKARLAEFPLCVGWPTGHHGSFPVMATCTDHVLSVWTHPELAYDPDNLQSLCGECNRRKAVATEGAWGRTERPVGGDFGVC
jgi:5-methylcytosine-specific restriction endonuclease McrA